MDKYNQALRYEIFEKEEYALAKKAIINAKVIFDIGGHLGYFSEWCKSLNQKTKIHYFEPVPVLYQETKERLKDDKNLILNNLGIGNKEGTIPFLLNQEKTMQSSKYSSFLNSKGEQIEVKMTTFKHYLNKQEPLLLMRESTVIKIDIEGMEFEVLENWENEIFEKIGSLIIEVHLLNDKMKEQYKLTKIRLINLGYSLIEEENPYSKHIFLLFATDQKILNLDTIK